MSFISKASIGFSKAEYYYINILTAINNSYWSDFTNNYLMIRKSRFILPISLLPRDARYYILCLYLRELLC
jgi:hypothetical protein